MNHNNRNHEIKIIELNCKSIMGKVPEIQKLINLERPDILCLSETWLQANDREPHLHGYSAIWKHRQGRGGGLGIIIESSLQYEPVNIRLFPNGKWEILAIKINLGNSKEWICILNVYNPNQNVTKEEMKYYMDQLGNKFIIMGDFNAHTPVLDNTYHNYRNAAGKALEDLLIEENIILINPINFITYIDYRTGRPSCLDVCLTSPNIAAQTSLSRVEDVGSDHSPIIATVKLKPVRCIKRTYKRWKTKGINWRKWKTDIPDTNITQPNEIESLNDDLVERLNLAAKSNIKLSSGTVKVRKSTPWWNSECSKRVALRRKAKKRCELHPTPENIAILRKRTAEAKYIIQKSKKESWREYINSLKMDTPIGEVWRKIKSIKSQYVPPNLNLKINDTFVETNKEKANLIGKYFQETGKLSGLIYQNDMDIVVEHNSQFRRELDEYNCEITLGEIQENIRTLKDTSPGIDNIPNSFLKHMPLNILKEVRDMFNTSWFSGMLPTIWKTGIIIPILKPGKEQSDIASYRPITLLSCIGKLMEKIICKRLEYFVENNRMLGKYQCGFRKGLSTIDVLLRLQNRIRQTIDKKEYCIVVYLDLKGAYDRIWHKGLLYKLANMGIRGNMFRWLQNYLSQRKIMVRVGDTLSDQFDIGTGVCQGAVLSPLLFNIMLADIPVEHEVDIYCYADDLTFSTSSKDIVTCTRVMQRYIERLVKWLEGWGLVVSQEKSSMQVFTSKRKNQNAIIRVKKQVIPCKKEQRLLGLILDAPNLTYKAHVNYLTDDIRKRLAIMKVLSSISWGASKKVLRNFYIAYVRSKMDYASVIYNSAARTILEKLDKLQNVALRLMLGAWKTSPILSMEVEAFIAPLSNRRQMLTAKKYLKLMNSPCDNVTAEMIGITNILNTTNNNPTKSFSSEAKTIMTTIQFKVKKRNNIEQMKYLPPWKSLSNYVKLDMPDRVGVRDREIFLDMCNLEYNNCDMIYTDGSKMHHPEISTTSSFYNEKTKETTNWKLHPDHSVLAAELFAIKQALSIINLYKNNTNYVIFTDSRTAASLIASPTGTYAPVVNEIQELILSLNNRKRVAVQWVKGHADIVGNTVADLSAKLAHQNNRSVMFPLMLQELISILKNKFLTYWDEDWKYKVELSNKGLFLRNLIDNIHFNNLTYHKTRRTEVTLSRLRIGHAAVKSTLHRFNLATDDLCQNCNVPETIQHLILVCDKYVVPRRQLIISLQNVGINNISLKVLLGNTNQTKNCRRFILKQLIHFLTATKTIGVL
jgi:ribonuclease HI